MTEAIRTPADFSQIGSQLIEMRRLQGERISPVHDERHLGKVAVGIQLIGDLYGFTPREMTLASATAWLHAGIRHPTEDPRVGDAQASANQARRTLELLSAEGVFDTLPEEREAIRFAIQRQNTTPHWLKDPATREYIPLTLASKLWFGFL